MTTCISKSQLAAEMGISMSTMRRYLQAIAPSLPDYNVRQKVLTPAQSAIFRRHYCLVEGE